MPKRAIAETNGTSRRRWGMPGLAVFVLAALAAPVFLSAGAGAQGILTVTPARSASTVAGTGTVGYTGDGGAAASATLAAPSAVAYDKAGNLYVADANNQVIRKVSITGTITTIAGTGIAGFGGDGGAATAALLDTPSGIAVDASGNVYIADSHNNRIREITGTTISTIAGTGVAGFGGDAGAATSALLSLPSAVAVDASGNVYIADTNNQRIRRVASGTITTIAGTGEQNFTGDGGTATAATLDSPTGVAVDTVGNVYIADRHNQRVREILGGTITTLAGSGAPTFAGGFSGDGATSTSSLLAKPTGVSVDAAGNVYVADTNNQRVREVGGGVIATVAGNGAQGFGGDGGATTASTLNAPKAATPDANGNLSIADTQGQRVRSGALPTLTFASQAVGSASAAQVVTLSNTGTASITVAVITFVGPFGAVSSGTCPAAPITLAAGASCTQNVAFLPATVSAAAGSVSFSGTGVVTQKILLTGQGAQTSTTATLVSDNAAPFINQPVTFTATVAPTTGAGVPDGTVNFLSNGVLLGTGTLANGVATYTTSFTTSGTYAITAVYVGNANYGSSTTVALPQLVGDFNFVIQPGPGQSPADFSITVQPGGAGVYYFTVRPLSGPFTFPITLSASGLPPGATVTFSPQTVTLGASPAMFTMTVQTAKLTASLKRMTPLYGGTMLALLLLPFARVTRKRGRKLRPLLMLLLCGVSLSALASLTGCGGGSGFFGEAQKTYQINVIATASGTASGTLQHVATVQLTIE